MHQPTRTERHERHARKQNQSREELQTNGDEPGGVGLRRTRAADVVGTVVDPEGDQNPETDGELLEGDKGAANFRGSDFCVAVGSG